MEQTRILILGASGMLGSAMLDCFGQSDEFTVTATVRNANILHSMKPEFRNMIRTNVDVMDENTLVTLLNETQPEIVINCIGLIKQLSSSNDPLVALPINALFPHRLSRLCALAKARLIHISTDCVFSGKKGNYSEDDQSDVSDIYGLSKLLGEVTKYENSVTLRTSIIGRELNSHHSLLEWFLHQNESAKGYQKAVFSGLPTNELARVIKDYVVPNTKLSGLYHVSSDPISKYELLKLFAIRYKKDIKILPDDKLVIDRSLNSERFRKITGYHPAQWTELVHNMK